MYNVFLDGLNGLFALDVVFVAAAGQLDNEEKKDNIPADMQYQLPQVLADLDEDDRPLIVVGGLDPNTGVETPDHFQDTAGHRSIAIWSTHSVQCEKPDFRDTRDGSGTSVATPTVAGVIADWLSVPGLVTYIDNLGNGIFFAAKVRKFLREQALQRPWLPDRPTLYNGMADVHCQQSPGDPKPDEHSVRRQAIDVVTKPAVVNGTVVDPFLKSLLVSWPFRHASSWWYSTR